MHDVKLTEELLKEYIGLKNDRTEKDGHY